MVFRRTVHSLVRLLALFPGIRLVYVSPLCLQMPPWVMEEVPLEQVQPTNVLNHLPTCQYAKPPDTA
jgi:aspartate carbamoyltransferase catalytic subunit